ncbi:10000_t:CDS:2, partial [Funneliformis geosporum]
AGNNKELTSNLNDALSSCEKIPFMAIENKGSTERINRTYRYVLRLYSRLINSQKALVTLTGIQVFFNIHVPDGESPDECEVRVRDIIFSAKVETQKIEYVKAFPFRGYHTEKKSYLRIYTSGTDKRKTAIQLGEFAEVLDLNHNVFMICMTLHWKDDPKPLKQICLIDVEENLLKAFAPCWRAFAPDIQVRFNDSDYDWSFIMKRAYHLNVLEWIWKRIMGKFEIKEEILKWKYKGKIGAKSEIVFKKKGKKRILMKRRPYGGQ